MCPESACGVRGGARGGRLALWQAIRYLCVFIFWLASLRCPSSQTRNLQGHPHCYETPCQCQLPAKCTHRESESVRARRTGPCPAADASKATRCSGFHSVEARPRAVRLLTRTAAVLDACISLQFFPSPPGDAESCAAEMHRPRNRIMHQHQRK